MAKRPKIKYCTNGFLLGFPGRSLINRDNIALALNREKNPEEIS